MELPAQAPNVVCSIKPINRQSIHRICSGQVILDLATAVKELIENALDAGATNVEVRLREYGSALVEVADNGRGVPTADYQALTLKYHTSKITSFDDLTSVSTYGFRGEALSSLCAVSELSVVTRTADQAAGVRLGYNHEGLLIDQSPTPRAVGTTVAVKNLFATMPVRHKEFLRNLKREFARTVAVLQAFALIATHARLVVNNQAGKGAVRTCVFTTTAPASNYDAYAASTATAPSAGLTARGKDGGGVGILPGCMSTVLASAAGAAAGPRVRAELAALRDNVVAVFGGRVAESLEPLVLPEDAETGLHVFGWISRAGCGLRGDASRQFFFLNGRPVDLPKAARVLNDCFKSLSSPAHAASCRPMAVLAVRLAAAEFDVNVTPDKRRVFMAAEDRLTTLLQRALQALWEPSRCTFAVNQPLPSGAAAVGMAGAGGGSLLVSAAAGGSQQSALRQQQLSVRRSTGMAVVAAFNGNCADAGGESQPGELNPMGIIDTAADATVPAPASAMVVAVGDERAPKRARHNAGRSTSPLASIRPAEPDDAAVEPPLGDGAAPTPAVMAAEEEEEAEPQQSRQQGSPGCRRRRTPVVAEVSTAVSTAPYRHPFLSMLSGFAATACTGKSSGPTTRGSNSGSNVEQRTTRELQPTQRLTSAEEEGTWQTRQQVIGEEEDEDAEKVVRGVAGEMQSIAEATTMDHEHLELGSQGVDMLDAGSAGDLWPGDMEKDKGLVVGPWVRERPSREGEDGAAAPRSKQPAPPSLIPVAVRHMGQAASAGATSSMAAVLRLEPGQLVMRTLARVRYLKAQQEQRRRRQEGEGGSGGGGGTSAGRRFTNASLLEDGGGGGSGSAGMLAGDGSGTRAEREAAAERELERVFRKHQFKEMRVLGQFNLGFILARHGSDVFIVDQHAAAEKTTFERLQRTVVLTRQPLLVPRPLPPGLLLPVDQLIMREHIDVFRRNGFDFVERRSDGRLVPMPGTTRGGGAGGGGFGADGGDAVVARLPLQTGAQIQMQSLPQVLPSEQQQQQVDVQTVIKTEVDRGGQPSGRVKGSLGDATAAEAAGARGVDNVIGEECGGDVVGQRQEQGEGWFEDEDSRGGSNRVTESCDAYNDTGGELLLSSVPVSRATGQLGMDDVVELVGLLRAGQRPLGASAGEGGGREGTDGGPAEGVTVRQRAWEEELRPSRVRAMLASRACRSSVMVGKPLSRAEMRRLLDALADLRQPWNCPHGRPTMRHVCVLPNPPGLPPT